MLVFIDESGDSGFKLDKGSSPIFALAMVIFHDRTEAMKCQEAILACAAENNVAGEFKFNKSRPHVKDAFFKAVSPFNFRVRVLVVEKEHIYSGRLRTNKDAFYQFCMKTMLKFDNGVMKEAKIVIDGSGDRDFKKELKTHLKKHCAKGAVKSIDLKDSHRDPLIQLADMCIGAVARSYRADRKDADKWRKMLRSKLDDIWNFQ